MILFTYDTRHPSCFIRFQDEPYQHGRPLRDCLGSLPDSWRAARVLSCACASRVLRNAMAFNMPIWR
jgi:hypothetical protein